MQPRKRVLVPRIHEPKPIPDIFNSLEGTDRKRQFLVVPRPGTSLFQVAIEHGGPVPSSLKGAYTRETDAERAIRHYLNLELL